MKKIIGVDIGGTKCAVTLGIGSLEPEDESIEITDRIYFSTEHEISPEAVINRVCKEIVHLLENRDESLAHINSIGISCGGPLDSDKGLILSPPNLPGWDNIPVVKILENLLGIRAYLQNDANACALAEWKYGAGRGSKNMIFLTFGTGLGAGMILNGQLYTGACNMAGEIGHIRMENFGPVGYGKAGSLEGFCSGGGIAQLARIKALERYQQGQKVAFCECINKLGDINAKIVGDFAEAGDELAKEIYEISGEYLGRGLSILIDILNPERIIIGSIFSRSRDLLWASASSVIQRESINFSVGACSIMPAELGEKVGDYAALTVALYN